MKAILYTKEAWTGTQLSMARYYGRVRLNGATYIVVDELGRDLFELSALQARDHREYLIESDKPMDLVREDFVKFYRKLGRERFIEILKEYGTLTDAGLKKIYKEEKGGNK